DQPEVALELLESFEEHLVAQRFDEASLVLWRARKATYLLQLGRDGEAQSILEECRRVCEAIREAAGDTAGLGAVLVKLALCESRAGHLADALRFNEKGLALLYLAEMPEPASCAMAHYNLSYQYQARDEAPARVAAHRATAVLLWFLVRSPNLGRFIAGLADI